MGILVFLLTLTLVVFVHELGHYLACRAFSIPVKKFGVGLGKPLLKRTDKRGTEWSIRPFPLGGFVQPDARLINSASPLKKFIVAIAGPLANLGPFGVFAACTGTFRYYIGGLWDIYAGSLVAVFNTLTFGIFHSAADVHSGMTTSSGGLVGPIGLGASAVQMNNDAGPLVAFIVLFISLNLGLGLINLMPVPLFDGGRAVLAGVEAAVGQQRSRRVEKVANYFGLAVIAALVLIVTTHDIVNLF